MTFQKILRTTLLSLTILFLSSCTVTGFIWGDKSYDERVEQFFVGSDGRYVVLVGTNYHYVFTDNSGTFRDILSLKQTGVLSLDTDKTHLKLDSNNDIEGSFVMHGPFSLLPPEDQYRLQALRFFPDRNDTITIKIKLAGRRYAAKYLNQNLSQMSSIRTIRIHYNDSGIVKNIGKTAVTPIAVGLDAVLIIGKIAIYPFTL